MSEYRKAYYRAHKAEQKECNKKWRIKNENHPAVASHSKYSERYEENLYEHRKQELEELANRIL